TVASVVENSPTSTVIYQASATDPDGDRVFWSLEGGSEIVTIDQSGAVRLVASADFEAMSSYDFTVVATDASGEGTTRSVHLTITDVIESTPVIAETTAANDLLGDAQLVDPNDLEIQPNPNLPNDSLPS